MEDLQEEPELEECEEGDEGDIEEDKSTSLDTTDTPSGQSPVRCAKPALLQTNFSVTGINEIKTEHIPVRSQREYNDLPLRPVSLYLTGPSIETKKRPESVHADTALIDPTI